MNEHRRIKRDDESKLRVPFLMNRLYLLKPMAFQSAFNTPYVLFAPCQTSRVVQHMKFKRALGETTLFLTIQTSTLETVLLINSLTFYELV